MLTCKLSTGDVEQDAGTASDRQYIAVVTRAATVNDQKSCRSIRRNQRVVPYPLVVVHALATVGDKGAYVLQCDLLTNRCHDHDEGQRIERHKGLAAERVALHAEQVHGQLIRLGVKQIDQCLIIGPAGLYLG